MTKVRIVLLNFLHCYRFNIKPAFIPSMPYCSKMFDVINKLKFMNEYLITFKQHYLAQIFTPRIVLFEMTITVKQVTITCIFKLSRHVTFYLREVHCIFKYLLVTIPCRASFSLVMLRQALAQKLQENKTFDQKDIVETLKIVYVGFMFQNFVNYFYGPLGGYISRNKLHCLAQCKKF